MAIDQDKAKARIQDIVNGFRSNYQTHKQELEANTETKLVEPLFKALGWSDQDIEKQAKAQRGSRSGHADYAFKIDDKIVFFLEVKRVGVSLEKEADRQVISYALSKRIPFAVSTNFEELKIFCVEQKDAIKNKFRVFNKPEEYTDNFSDLMFLSRESFEQDLTLKKAENEGRLRRRASIDKSLLEDLMHIRKLIANDIEKSYPDKYKIGENGNEKDEIIQRILDRLIFIRKCEDTNINPENLMLEEILTLPDNKAYPKLKEVFKVYDNVYNSGLFAVARDNDCDTIHINGSIIKKLVACLYESKNKEYIYNFDWINADVLGQVYEQYLGNLLKQTKSGRSKLKDGQAHRKEQGIYYTPTYIVDYIVRTSINDFQKNNKSNINKIKVLDSACGSGSFLIKAFDYLYNEISLGDDSKQRRIDSQGMYSAKTQILKNNIFGVDLDNKAVEITKLNLLLKAAEKGRKLPEELDLHIRSGNSLFDDESVFGIHAFNWIGDFQKGSFDIIIGNPPYVDIKGMPPEQVKAIFENYDSAENRVNLYSIFIERSLDLLKEGGYFGFIIPNSLLFNSSYKKIREKLLKETNITKIVRLPDNVFEDAKVETILLLFRKKSKRKIEKTEILLYGREDKIDSISTRTAKSSLKLDQNSWLKNENKTFNIFSTEAASDLTDKIEKNRTHLIDLCDFSLGLTPYDKYKGHSEEQIRSKAFHSSYQIDETYKKLLSGADIIRYGVFWNGEKWIKYGAWLGAAREKRFFADEHILVRQIVSGNPLRIYAAYCDEELYNAQIGFNLVKKTEVRMDLKVILAILNSKLMNFYHTEKFLDKSKNLFQKILIQNAKAFPIQVPDPTTEKRIVSLVDKMISLTKRLNQFGEKKTSETSKLEELLSQTDSMIDGLIYDLYDLNSKEKQLVEESFSI